MTVSSGELASLITDIQNLLTGSRVKKVHQLNRYDIVILFREKGAGSIFLSVHPRFGRILFTEKVFSAPSSPTPFAMLLRKHLTGKSLASVEKPVGERFVQMRFSPGGYSLFSRFYSGGGFLLVDEKGTVQGLTGFTKTPSIKTGGVFAVPPPRSAEEAPSGLGDSPSKKIEAFYEEKIKKAEEEEEKRKARSGAKLQLKRQKRKLTALLRDKNRLLEYEPFRKWGDLCGIHFNKIPRGAKEATLADPSSGNEIKITLAPDVSLKKNIALFYKKHRKYANGLPEVESKINESEKKIGELEDDIREIEKADTPEEAAKYRSMYVREKKAAPPQKKAAKKGEKSSFRRFVTSDGFEAFVGRNNIQNDELVRKSNGNDLWFHLRDFPGSHVVVRAKRNKQLPFATVTEAAQFALKYSSRANDKEGTVIYTQIKNIKRPKGSPPGKVTVTREKTIRVRLS